MDFSLDVAPTPAALVHGGMQPVIDRPLRPSRSDTPVNVLIPARVASSRISKNIGLVADQGAKLSVISELSERTEGAIVLNWGVRTPMPNGTINSGTAATLSADKLECLHMLGDLAPRNVLRARYARLLPGDLIVAKKRTGRCGQGKAVLPKNTPRVALQAYDIFQEFLADRREYRVSVLNGEVANAYFRRPSDPNPLALSQKWTYEPIDEIPVAVVEVAIEAAGRVGLGYSGVDIVEDLTTGRTLCFETNSAPGMSVRTINNVYELLQGRPE